MPSFCFVLDAPMVDDAQTMQNRRFHETTSFLGDITSALHDLKEISI